MTVFTMLKSIGYMLKCSKYLYYAKKLVAVAIVVLFFGSVISSLSSGRDVALKVREWIG